MAASRWQIAITGVGLVTPLGLTASQTVDRILRGETGVTVSPDGVPMGKVAPFDLAPMLRNPKNIKLLSHPVQMALLAAKEALSAARISEPAISPERLGVFVGSGQTGLEYDEFFKALTLAWDHGREQDYKYLGGMPAKLIDRYFSLRTLANAGVAAISTEFNARGPSNNYVQGEVAGAAALQNACYALMENRCDAAIVAAYDGLLIPSNLAAFRAVGLLSPPGSPPRYVPFDRKTTGLVLGEGAAAFIVESHASAAQRGVPVWGEIDGIGMAISTRDEPEACVNPEDLSAAVNSLAVDASPDFVIARGLGAVHYDAAESRGLGRVLGDQVPVTALKSYTTYLGAATAAVELGIGMLCAKRREVPPIDATANASSARLMEDSGSRLNLLRERPLHLNTPEPKGLFISGSFAGQVAAIAARSEVCEHWGTRA